MVGKAPFRVCSDAYLNLEARGRHFKELAGT